MVRGIRSSTSAQHAKLFTLLAELTAAGFFQNSFVGMCEKPQIDDKHYPDLVFAMSLVALVFEHAQGFHFLPFINGDAVARLDGKEKTSDTELLYNVEHKAPLKPNPATAEALKQVPSVFALPGYLYSKKPDMQTKAILMTQDMFSKLLLHEMTMDEVNQEALLCDIDALRFTDMFMAPCEHYQCLPRVWENDNVPSARWDARNNQFAPSEVHHFVQGTKFLCENNRKQEARYLEKHSSVAALNLNLMRECIRHRFAKLDLTMELSFKFHTAHEAPRVITHLLNTKNDSDTTRSKLHEIQGATLRFNGYLNVNTLWNEQGTLWERVRPFLAIAHDVYIDQFIAGFGWETASPLKQPEWLPTPDPFTQ